MMKTVEIKTDYSLAPLTTFHIGGPARYYTVASTIEQMQEACSLAKEKGWRRFILGKGSNSLFDDRGFNGLVIHNKIDHFEELDEGLFRVGAGYSFSLLGTKAARRGWSGLEFAAGIPGSVGGAVWMNAGANGSETEETLQSVLFMDAESKIHTYSRQDLTFGYRTSSFQQMEGEILEVTFALKKDEEARERQQTIIRYRTDTQPYGQPSAGCLFRNPSQEPAGAIIERLGLKGKSVGGAEVSTLHGNFIVNKGGATAQDVLDLAKEVQNEIYEKIGVKLEQEIRYIPFEENIK